MSTLIGRKKKEQEQAKEKIKIRKKAVADPCIVNLKWKRLKMK